MKRELKILDIPLFLPDLHVQTIHLKKLNMDLLPTTLQPNDGIKDTQNTKNRRLLPKTFAFQENT
jgi:hypothetical protein